MRTSTTVDGWVVRATSGPVPAGLDGVEVAATVPGTVHTDLLDAGLIPDPYVDEGERELAWMRRASWRYSTRVRLEPPGPDERVDLVFAGIDTVATVDLGGEVVARTANMHRSHRVDVRAAAAAAAGDPLPLTVDLSSALEHAEAEQERIGFRPGAYPQPLNMVRKMACSFGWDWGPDLQTAGLWQPVTVERWRVARIAAVRPLVSVAGDHSTRHRQRAPRRRALRDRFGASRTHGGGQPRRPAGHRARRRRRGRAPSSRWSSTTPCSGGRAATARPFSTTSPSSCSTPTAACSTPGRAASGCAASRSTRPPTSTAPRSRSPSTGGRCSSRGPTGSPTTTCSPASPASGSPGGSTRRSARGSTCCGSGAAASTRARTSTSCATRPA